MTDEPTIAGAPKDTILDANTYEAHVWLAQRAIGADELTLAITHLRLALELQDAIVARADRAHVERAGRDAWEKASPATRAAALDKLGALLGEETAMVPLVGQTRDERPDRVYPTLAAPPIWACDRIDVHAAHAWEEQTESGRRPYRCLGRTVAIAGGRESRPSGASVMLGVQGYSVIDTGSAPMTNHPIGSRLFAVKAPGWSPEEAHTERIDVPAESSVTRVCAVCGDAWRYCPADGNVPAGAYHVAENGNPLVRQLHVPHE